MTADSVPTLGWEVIASGDAGPGVRSRHGLAFDRAANRVVLFGGIVWSPEWTLPADTWELRGRRWLRVRTGDTPPGRHRGAMAYLDAQKQTLLFGGQGEANNFLGDTWTYVDQRWRRVRPGAPAPSPRCGHSLAYDETASVAVLFGGVDAAYNSRNDTWLFDGRSWEQVHGKAPPARRYAGMAYDARLKGCLLHGGSDDEAGDRSFGETWLFRDRAWILMPRSFDTEPRDDHGFGYHQDIARMVMLVGVSAERGILVCGETNWQRAEATPLHRRHQCSPLVWNADLNGLLLHGGETGHQGKQFHETLLLWSAMS